MAQFKAALLSGTQPVIPQQQQAPVYSAPAPKPEAPQKKSKAWIIITASVAAAALVFIAGFTAINLFGNKNSAENSQTSPQLVTTNSDSVSLDSSSSAQLKPNSSSSSSSAVALDDIDETDEIDDSLGERVDFTFFSIEVPDGMVYEENDQNSAVYFYDDYNYDANEEYHMGLVFSIIPLDSESDFSQYPRAKRLGKSKGYYLAALLPTDVQWDPDDDESEKSYKALYDNYEEILDTIELKN